MNRRAFQSGLVVLVAFGLVIGASVWMRPHEVIPWRTDLSAAAQESKRTGKPILLDFSADWCGPCREMRRTTWSDPAVARALAGYIPVQVDVDAHPDVAARFAVNGIPRLLVLDPHGTILKSSVGEMDSGTFTAWLDAPRPGETPAFLPIGR